MEGFFDTRTICEHMTSQTCPCCRVEGSLKKEKREINKYEIHHLLRCTNVACKSRLWNRNVVGSFNILQRFIQEVIGGTHRGDEAASNGG